LIGFCDRSCRAQKEVVMVIRRATILVAAGAIALTGLPATPAAAAAAAAVEFRCVGHAPVWPSVGQSYTTCHGTANEAWTDLTFARSCVPECPFYMTINYESPCIPPAPFVAASFWGEMHIVGGGSYDYRATVVGPLVTFTPPQVAGAGVFVPHPPIPTCGASGPMTFELAGVVTLSP
jgi:hypothetical protein